MKYIDLDKLCKDCKKNCSKNIRDISVCIINKPDIIFDTNAKLHEIKDMIRFTILWHLDNEKCEIALNKNKELNKCINTIIKDLTKIQNLSIILKNQDI